MGTSPFLLPFGWHETALGLWSIMKGMNLLFPSEPICFWLKGIHLKQSYAHHESQRQLLVFVSSYTSTLSNSHSTHQQIKIPWFKINMCQQDIKCKANTTSRLLGCKQVAWDLWDSERIYHGRSCWKVIYRHLYGSPSSLDCLGHTHVYRTSHVRGLVSVFLWMCYQAPSIFLDLWV